MNLKSSNKVVFITGASGFIGKALTERILATSPHTTVVLLSRSDSFDQYKNNTQVIPILGDINNIDLMVHTLQKYQVTHVYHLASEAIIATYTKNPLKAYLATVQGVTTLLEATRLAKTNLSKVIVGTSYKVYGQSAPPYNELTQFTPGNTYETAKACQDLIAQDYYRSFNVPVVIFRPVNIYGPGDTHLSRLTPKVCNDIVHKIAPTVYSSVQESIREFIYIDDLLDALVLIEEKAEPGDTFCIGGHSESIYNYVKKICKVSDFDQEPQLLEVAHVAETKEHTLDCSKIRFLGWEMKYSLDEGLKKTFEYYKTITPR